MQLLLCFGYDEEYSCSQCDNTYDKSEIYKDQSGHKYCLECLLTLFVQSKQRSIKCRQNKCGNVISIEIFERHPSFSRNLCDFCKLLKNEQSKKKQCGHQICKNCNQKHYEKCSRLQDIVLQKDNAKKKITHQNHTRCDICQDIIYRDFLFINKQCQHKICIECCQKRLNQQRLQKGLCMQDLCQQICILDEVENFLLKMYSYNDFTHQISYTNLEINEDQEKNSNNTKLIDKENVTNQTNQSEKQDQTSKRDFKQQTEQMDQNKNCVCGYYTQKINEQPSKIEYYDCLQCHKLSCIIYSENNSTSICLCEYCSSTIFCDKSQKTTIDQIMDCKWCVFKNQIGIPSQDLNQNNQSEILYLCYECDNEVKIQNQENQIEKYLCEKCQTLMCFKHEKQNYLCFCFCQKCYARLSSESKKCEQCGQENDDIIIKKQQIVSIEQLNEELIQKQEQIDKKHDISNTQNQFAGNDMKINDLSEFPVSQIEQFDGLYIQCFNYCLKDECYCSDQYCSHCNVLILNNTTFENDICGKHQLCTLCFIQPQKIKVCNFCKQTPKNYNTNDNIEYQKSLLVIQEVDSEIYFNMVRQSEQIFQIRQYELQ